MPRGCCSPATWWTGACCSRKISCLTRDCYIARNITDRVQAIAPFLRFDTDPYLVIADAGEVSKNWGTGPSHGSPPEANPNFEAFQERNPDISPDNFNVQTDENYLYWIIDAYTISGQYPYSDPGENDFNYIRNSVKVVVDAYNGAIAFYVVDPDDPIIQTWDRLLPGYVFTPGANARTPCGLTSAYPQDLFQVQADTLMTYHMTGPPGVLQPGRPVAHPQ